MGDARSRGTAVSFPEALRAGIAGRGVSLDWLHGRLVDLGTPVSVSTLSYWRSGRSQPEHRTSLDALATLEELLYLPVGDLRSRLRPSRRPGPSRGTKSLGELMGGSTAVLRAFEWLGFDPYDSESMVETSIQVTFDVDEEGRGRSAVTRSVWRALRDGTQGHPFVFWMANPSAHAPEFRAISGCFVGETFVDPESGLFAVEVLLDRPLMTGETASSEHQVLVPVDAPPDHFYEIYLTRRIPEAVLWIRFDPARVPTHCEVYREDPRTSGVEILGLTTATSAHHVVHNFGPGKVGIRWRW